MKTLLTPNQVAERLGLKKRTFLERVAPRPDFPARVRINRQTFYWYDVDVERWLEKQQEQRPRI